MTTTEPVHVEPVQTTAERSPIASPVGWSSIFAATAVAVGVWFVLHLFGIGVGLTAIDPQDTSSLRAIGIGTGIWSLIAPLIALFIGGLVAGRVAPTINTLNAVIHGAVVWALSGIVALVFLSMLVGSTVRAVSSSGQMVTNLAGQTVGAAAEGGGSMMSSLGIDTKDLIAPINERLQQQGMPPVTPQQMEAVIQEAAQTAVREGGIDRQQLVGIITKQTNLSRSDAEQLAAQLEQRVQQARQQGGQMVEQAKQTALQAAEATGKLLLVLSIMMMLGLGAAVLGSILSVRRERREHVVLPRAMTR